MNSIALETFAENAPFLSCFSLSRRCFRFHLCLNLTAPGLQKDEPEEEKEARRAKRAEEERLKKEKEVSWGFRYTFFLYVCSQTMG